MMQLTAESKENLAKAQRLATHRTGIRASRTILAQNGVDRTDAELDGGLRERSELRRCDSQTPKFRHHLLHKPQRTFSTTSTTFSTTSKHLRHSLHYLRHNLYHIRHNLQAPSTRLPEHPPPPSAQSPPPSAQPPPPSAQYPPPSVQPPSTFAIISKHLRYNLHNIVH